MSIFGWVRSALRRAPVEKDGFSKGRNFDSDYASATNIIKERLNAKFPDSYHASMRSNSDPARDHGADRKDAIDAISKEIALALRQGATVREASARGARSAGL